MKNNWWDDLAEEFQDAADRKDYKCFYDNLKKAYGPCDVHSASIRSKDGATLYTSTHTHTHTHRFTALH